MQQLEGHLSKSAVENINKWLTEPKYADYKHELEELIIAEAWEQLEDSFYKVLEFGTAGRRGKTGVGSNRINRVTVGESAQALCEYVLSFDPEADKKGLVIAYDTRLTSPDLSRLTAQVAAANGFKTYLFDGFRATPELSFAVRHLGCAVGVVISASHNPPEDNGFKAYWSDGCQLVSPHDKGVLAVANKITDIKMVDYDKAVDEGKIIIIGKEVDDSYVATVVSESLGPDRDINIVYSPLHGTGQRSVLTSLRLAGFENISVVEAQMVPDGNFPTIKNQKPNPEEKSANEMAVNQMMAEQADIAITNDPDADRIGVIVKQGDEAVYLNGNQSYILAADYALKQLKEANKLTSRCYIVKTIVTTEMLHALADYYGAKLYGNLLIGFKYVGSLILSKENTDEVFVIGGEESFGMLKGDYARDKDGASGTLMLAEYAAQLKKNGRTLYDRLLELYQQHGLYIEKTDTMSCVGPTGFEKMQNIMKGIRQSVPKKVGGYEVTSVLDYKTLEKTDVKTGTVSPIDCVSGEVFVLEFGDYKRKITIRPSGTEPKLKFYIQWFKDADNSTPIKQQYVQLNSELSDLSKELEALLDQI
jgi:phosphoglucomutase